ncbi:MAG: hypothetical protein ACNA7Y_01340 [Gammaproteobacteria bacterium]
MPLHHDNEPFMITLPLQHIELLNGNTYRAFFDNTGLIYQAGQYLEILLPDTAPRPFSIANKPGNLIELHIRWLPDSPYIISLIDHITTNKSLTIQGPFGHCIYHKIPEYPSVLIASGTGFAPLKAIIEKALAEEDLRKPMHLYWGARTEAELYLNDLPTLWAQQHSLFRYTPIFGRTPLLQHTLDAVLADYPHLSHHHLYASGPFDLVHAIFKALKPHGLETNLTYSDAL